MGLEKVFENRIKRYIEDSGGWYVKFFANAYTRKGIPDLLCCVKGRFLGIEVKAQNGAPTPIQKFRCNQIRDSGGLAFIVYPSGFDQLKIIIDGLNKDQIDRNLPLILK
jgi:hypothetical protein